MQTPRDRLDTAFQQLNLVLTFFPRVESALSVVLGVNLGMLAFLATKIPNLSGPVPPLVVSLVAAALLGGSLRFVYLGFFPKLDGGGSSLIYFRSIAQRTEVEFQETWNKQSDDTLAGDVLGQVWRNSEILSAKYTNLKHAYISLSLAVVPWVFAIAYSMM